MNEHIDELLRDGMERFTADVRAPTGLARTAGRARPTAEECPRRGGVRDRRCHRRRGSRRGGRGQQRPGANDRRRGAGTHDRVRGQASRECGDGEHLVFRGRTVSGPPSISWISWAYGPRNRLEEFSRNGCGHVLPNASCTHRGRSQAVLDQGTALIGGKLTGVYVTYYNRKWSLSPGSLPASACSRTGALEMGGPVLGNNWPAFIHATLACGAATVTGHVRIDGVEATKITGSPVTVRLQANYAKVIREKWLRERWTLYVNPKTYLPVRLSSSSFSFGGPAR